MLAALETKQCRTYNHWKLVYNLTITVIFNNVNKYITINYNVYKIQCWNMPFIIGQYYIVHDK